MSQHPPPHPPPGLAPPAAKKTPVMLILGIIAGSLVLVLMICGGAVALILLPALSKARDSAQEIRAMTSLRVSAMSLTMYASENNEWMPEAREGWVERITPYLVQGATPRVSRTVNDRRVPVIYVPPGTPGEFDASNTIVLYEDTDALPDGEGVLCAFADGSVRKVPREEFRRLMLGRE